MKSTGMKETGRNKGLLSFQKPRLDRAGGESVEIVLRCQLRRRASAARK